MFYKLWFTLSTIYSSMLQKFSLNYIYIFKIHDFCDRNEQLLKNIEDLTINWLIGRKENYTTMFLYELRL